jgi:thioredoxin-like negative regulator of GroEL
MQFQEISGGRIRLVRYTGYNTEKKRSEIKVLGSFKGESISDELRALLTDQEKTELDQYLKNKRDESNQLHAKLSVKYLHSTVSKAAQHITNDEVPLTNDEAQQLFAAIEILKKSLRKAGHKHVKSAHIGKKPDPNQAALPLDE